ncbi:hypothetical protein N665_2475s0001 [Sinapis alba]|nr:hypothetical protein N665_2475s0001 [Sinapis alba]
MRSLKEREKRRKFDTYTTREDEPNEVVEEGTKADEYKVGAEEIQVDTNSKEEDKVVPKKLYVEGIPYQSTEEEILSFFKSCGVITKVDCKMRPEDGACIAYITFETEDGANRALAFDRAAMGDRYLTIQQYVKPTPSIPTRRTSSGFVPDMVEEGYNMVCIGNLACDTTERDIRKLFSGCVINSVRLGKNKETGEFKGCAHVDFKDSLSVAMALKLDQQVICGRPVKIRCALKERSAGDNRTPGETNNFEETYAIAADPISSLAVPSEVNNGNYTATRVGSGKIKRRICYVCREKGHLATACPKKLHTNAKVDHQTVEARPIQETNYNLLKKSGDTDNNGCSYTAATNGTNDGSSVFAVS